MNSKCVEQRCEKRKIRKTDYDVALQVELWILSNICWKSFGVISVENPGGQFACTSHSKFWRTRPHSSPTIFSHACTKHQTGAQDDVRPLQQRLESCHISCFVWREWRLIEAPTLTIQLHANSFRSPVPRPPPPPPFLHQMPFPLQPIQSILAWVRHWVMLDCTPNGLVSNLCINCGIWFTCIQTTTPHTQPFYGPFSGTTKVSWCQKSSGLYGARED